MVTLQNNYRLKIKDLPGILLFVLNPISRSNWILKRWSNWRRRTTSTNLSETIKKLNHLFKRRSGAPCRIVEWNISLAWQVVRFSLISANRFRKTPQMLGRAKKNFSKISMSKFKLVIMRVPPKYKIKRSKSHSLVIFLGRTGSTSASRGSRRRDSRNCLDSIFFSAKTTKTTKILSRTTSA